MATLRVGFDTSILHHSIGGVSRYTRGLCAALAEAAPGAGMEFVTVDVPASHPGSPPDGEASVRLDSPWYSGVPVLRRLALSAGWEAGSRSRRLAAALGCRVYHHSGVQPHAPAGSVSVLTLFDTTGLEHPEWHTEETVRYCRTERDLVAGGARMLAISRWAADRASAVMGVPVREIGVAPGAADGLFAPGAPVRDVLERLGLVEQGYLLHVGNFVPRKNIPMLLGAFEAARQAGLRLELVMVGQGGWRRPAVSGRGVRMLEAVPDSELLSLYRGAVALLMPSECEGLGLPVLEALACSCGVVASDAAALPETVGRGGMLLPPDDLGAWASAMLRLGSGGLAGELRSMAASAPRRTWSGAAEAACSFYRECAE